MDDFMKCSQCLEANRQSIAKNGYAYGYIGNQHDCYRHNRPLKIDNTVKLTNRIPCEKHLRK